MFDDPPEVSISVAKAHEELPPLIVLRRDLWWPSTGYGYFPTPEGHAPPVGGAYLSASSWEPMLPEAGLPEALHPKPAEPKSPSITLPSQPSPRGASEPASGTPSMKQPSAIFPAMGLPNYVCNLPAYFPLRPPIKAGPPTARDDQTPTDHYPVKAVPYSMVVNEFPALGQHAAKPAVVGPKQEPPPPPPIPPKKPPAGLPPELGGPPKKPPAGLPPEYRAGPQPVK